LTSTAVVDDLIEARVGARASECSDVRASRRGRERELQTGSTRATTARKALPTVKNLSPD
jgi:hypothetical protein